MRNGPAGRGNIGWPGILSEGEVQGELVSVTMSNVEQHRSTEDITWVSIPLRVWELKADRIPGIKTPCLITNTVTYLPHLLVSY